MSLVSLAPYFEKEGTFAEDSEYTYSYIGQSNDVQDQPEDIKSSALCPEYGDRDPQKRGNFIVNVRVRPMDTDEPGYWWIITTDSSPNYQAPENPLRLAAVIEWDTDPFTNYASRDNKGKPLLNKANDRLIVPVEDSRWVITVRKNMPRPPGYLLNFNNAINSSVVNVDGISFRQEKLMCKRLRIGGRQEAEYNGRTVYFREVSFQLHYRYDGWKVTHDNVGYNEIHRGLYPALDDNGHQIINEDNELVSTVQTKKRRIMVGDPPEVPTEPQALTREGKAIENPRQSDIIELEFEVYRSLNFSQLPLR